MEKRLELTFPLHLVKEPLIYQVGQKFKVVTNIRRANVTAESGWVVLGMEGDEAEIQKAINYLENKGVIVNPVEKDVVE